MARAPRSLDVKMTVMVKVGDREPIELAQVSMPWPYDVPKALAPALRTLADETERHGARL